MSLDITDLKSLNDIARTLKETNAILLGISNRLESINRKLSSKML